MCGICGELRFDGAPVNPGALEAMRDRIAHRGPDHADRYVAPEGQVGLGFRRLQIIDLSAPANQPVGVIRSAMGDAIAHGLEGARVHGRTVKSQLSANAAHG